MTSKYVEQFLEKLNGVRETGDGWAARCPCRNDDDNPSLSVTEGDDGRVLAICHRGSPCNFPTICESMGVKIQDTMPHKEEFLSKQKPKLTLVKTYDYHDSDGVLLFQKLRYVDENNKKTFRQRKPDGKGGWEYSLGSTPKVLYNLPQVLAAKSRGVRIFVVEGEKDADALIDKGAVATTMPGGAGKWLPIHTEALAGAEVDVIADNDEVGLEHARTVVAELRKAGCTVRGWRSSIGKDVYDLLAGGGTFKDLLELEDQPAAKTAEVLVDEPEEVVETPDERDEVSEVIAGISKLFDRTDLSMSSKVNRASLLINSLTLESPVDTGRLVPWGEFIEENDDDSYDWVIPGVLERQERVIVVAAEGVGKTMLARQVAICSAAGIQPFTRQRMKPITTLTIDLENPERIIRRTSRLIVQNARALGYSKDLQAHILIKPAGLDLLKMSDRKIVEEAIERIKPDLVLIGPLYKSFIDPGGRTPEAIAVEIAKYFDMIRDVYNCALWLEHHAPLGNSMSSRDLRPFGSAVWSRWPEFGLALQPDPTNPEGYVYEVNHFRGARDQRHFPIKMKRGKYFPFESLEFAKVD